MQSSDLDFAAERTQAEGWASETRAVFEAFLRHDPTGCFIAERKGKPIGLCVATAYRDSGFLGELIVTPEARGGDIGPRLLDHAMRYLHEKGIESIYLEGERSAAPYYQFVGFRKVCRSHRYVGKIAGEHHPTIRPMVDSDLDAVFRLDKVAFGDDRSFFLRNLWSRFPDYCMVAEQDGALSGFLLAQPGIGLVTAGPWIVDDSMDHPEHLVESLALVTGDNPIRLGVLETNEAAVRALQQLRGFEKTFYCWRMVLGDSDRLGNTKMSYAIGAPGKG